MDVASIRIRDGNISITYTERSSEAEASSNQCPTKKIVLWSRSLDDKKMHTKTKWMFL